MASQPPSQHARDAASTRLEPGQKSAATTITPAAHNALISCSPTYAKASLTRSALTCIIQFIPSSGGGVGNLTRNVADEAHMDDGLAAAPFVSAEGLFSQAAQPPSSLAVPVTLSQASTTITRPLALLAAAPHCRRGMEENLVGGCVLAPNGALVLQVRPYDPALTPSTLYSSSGMQKNRGDKKGHGSRTPVTASVKATNTTERIAESAQLLTVTSIHAPVSTRSLLLSPSRASEPRAHSARVYPASPPSPPQASQSHTLLPPATFATRSPTSLSTTTTRAALPTMSSSGRAVIEQRSGVLGSSVGSFSPPLPRTTLSPVLQSRRVPVSALQGVASSLPSLPPLQGGSAAFTNGLHSCTTQGRGKGPGGGASTPPSPPSSFATLSPRARLPSPPSSTPPHAAATAGPAPFPNVPPALLALCRAMWWVRRGPLPVSLSLLRYSEADVQALWDMLKADAFPESDESDGDVGDDNEGATSQGLAHNSCVVCPKDARECAEIAQVSNVVEQELDEDVRPTGLSSSRALQPLPSFSHFSGRAGTFTATMCARDAKRAMSTDVAPAKGSSALTATPPLLPSPVTELHVHGLAADTAIAALLHDHPEVRAIRLTHTTLSAEQLRDLARCCPDVTHLSLAMNDRLRSTSFLCATPSDTSSVATTATTTTTATTRASTAVPQLPQPPMQPEGSRSRSPRSFLPQRVREREGPPASLGAGPTKSTSSFLNMNTEDSRRSSQLMLKTVRGTRVGSGQTEKDEDGVSGEERGQGGHGNAANEPEGSRGTRAAPQTTLFQKPRQPVAREEELHNSQIDLFAAEEEGEAEMRFSLWQAAQTDAAERRQAVFILRPSDVVLGDAGVEGARREHGEARQTTPSPSLGRGGHTATQTGSADALLLSPLSPTGGGHSLLPETDDGDDVTSTVSVNCTDTTARQPPSVSTTTQYTDPLRSPLAPLRSVDATLADLKSSLWRFSGGSAAASSVAKMDKASKVVTSPLHLRHHRSSRSRDKRASTRWSETLVDLDLSYTQVLDEAAARDLPRLRVLRRLSLEGCMRLSQVRWVPSLRSLRELNLSFSSVSGSALYPLGLCAQLVWLKLEGCASLVRLDQLWTAVEGPDGPHSLSAASPGTGSRSASATAPSTTRAMHHHTAGGIPAITVLPHTQATSTTPTAVEQEEEVRRSSPVHEEASGAVQWTALPAATTGRTAEHTPSLQASVPDVVDHAAAPLLTKLRVLIATSTGLTDAGLLPLQHLVSLECLVVDRCTALTNVNVVAQLPSLHTLDVSRTGVTAEGLTALRHVRTLRLLRLQECLSLTYLPALFVESSEASRRVGRFPVASDASTGGCGGISNADRPSSQSIMPGLLALDVSFCANLTAGGVEGLVVDAVTMQLRDAGAAAHGGRGGEPNATAVTGATDLASSVSGGGGGHPHQRVVAQPASCTLPQLRHLLLRSCDAVSRLSALRGFTRVVELDLYHTNVDAAVLAAATARWTCLEVLNIASTKVRTLEEWCPIEKTTHKSAESSLAAASATAPDFSDAVSTSTQNATAASVGSPSIAQLTPGLIVPARLPAFAATLRVLILSNTDVTSGGLAALRFFPRLEVLQLSNCRQLTSLSFLPLCDIPAEVGKASGRQQRRRTALRELTISEAADLTNEEAFPFLAACPGLRSLSLVGCAQIGGGEPPWATVSLPQARGTERDGLINRTNSSGSTTTSLQARSRTSQLQLPPIANPRGRSSSVEAGMGGPTTTTSSDLMALRCMGGLTDLNLSRTAVNQEDLRALFTALPAPHRRKSDRLSPEARQPARASARLNLLSTSEVAAAAAATALAPPDGEKEGNEDVAKGAFFFPWRDFPPLSLQRMWLRGCRFVDEDDLLAASAAAAAAAATAAPCARERTHSALGSVREVYLSQGRFDAAVLGGLLL